MAHKFAVGQAVEYRPVGANVGVFIVVKQMPDEPEATDFRYKIKNVQETFERNVLEYDLSASVMPEDRYEPMKPPRVSRSSRLWSGQVVVSIISTLPLRVHSSIPARSRRSRTRTRDLAR